MSPSRCTPEWGGVSALGSDPVAAQIGALRAIGGDVRISFGGESTATDAQVATAFGISDTAAWPMIAVTPMIGVNDTSDEIFTVANARQLVTFAASKHPGWLSMWSGARDAQCSGGAQSFPSPTCSSIVQSPDAFADALAAY